MLVVAFQVKDSFFNDISEARLVYYYTLTLIATNTLINTSLNSSIYAFSQRFPSIGNLVQESVRCDGFRPRPYLTWSGQEFHPFTTVVCNNI